MTILLPFPKIKLVYYDFFILLHFSAGVEGGASSVVIK